MTKHGLRMSEAQLQAQLAKTARLTAQQVANRTQPYAPSQVWAEPKPAKNKYKNEPVIVEGVKFASRKEAKVYTDLRFRLIAGEIKNLRRQVPYALVVNGIHIADYIADFVFEEGARTVVMDPKGVRTPAYRLKKKLMLACHSVEVIEV